MIKLSVLALYHEYVGGKLSRAIVLWVLALVVLHQWVGFTVFNLFICTPLTDVLNLRPGPRHCISTIPAFIANGALDAITHILILCLPIRYIWALQLRTRARIGVSVIYLLGGLYVPSFPIYVDRNPLSPSIPTQRPMSFR